MRNKYKVVFQVLRWSCQVSVWLFVVYTASCGAWRNLKLAHNSRHAVDLLHGEFWAWVYGVNDDVLSLFGRSDEVSLAFLGIPWSANVFGFLTTDPILAISHLLKSGDFIPKLWLGVLIPVVIAVVFGKVFCSYICPMRFLFQIGNSIRNVVIHLGVSLPFLSSNVRLGGAVLVGGLVASLFSGLVVWHFLLPYVGATSAVFIFITGGAGLHVILVPWMLWCVDVLFAPGFFCHNLCPQGFLLEQLGRWSLLRVRSDESIPCPTKCDMCRRSCPYGLFPKENSHAPACDNCGACVSQCPSSRLKCSMSVPRRSRSKLPIVGVSVFLFVLLNPLLFESKGNLAFAHHNKGLPHYGYFENYPQVPTEEFVNIDGQWEIGATIFNFQGLDRQTADTPNDVKIYIYLYNLQHDFGYVGKVDFEILFENRVIAKFSRESPDQEQIYMSREIMPESGYYEIIARLPVEGGEQRVSLEFYVDISGDGISWLVITAAVLPVCLGFIIAIWGSKRKVKVAASRKKSKALSA